MNKRVKILLTCTLIIQSMVQAQQKTSFGDDVSTLDGIMKAYYEVVCVKVGEKISYERDSLLHVPGALIGLPGKGKEGRFNLKLMSLKEYHRLADPGLEKDGFYEKEISRKVENFGGIYHVWSTYETRNAIDGPVTERGINSIEMYFDGIRFWITSWCFDNETTKNKIPKVYLSN